MKRTPKNLVFHELIGLPVKVLSALDPGVIGVEGVVVWETRRTLHVRSGDRVLVILKSGSVFLFRLPDGSPVKVRGDHILGSPAERARRMVWGR